MKRHKKWGIVMTAEGMFRCFTPDEMKQPEGFREWEYECASLNDAMFFINHYND